MSLHIDPKALNAFATDAAGHSADLKKINVEINLAPTSLGKFEEASDLVNAVNAHTAQVNQRLQATSDALWGLAQAASSAAKLSHASEDDITKQMKKINHQIDDARRSLGPRSS
jgi:methyl-accepting chemotaxis protein